MRIHDKVYGEMEVHEPLLLELIQSTPVQRMKGIYQGGAQAYVYPERNGTRYDHCIGVMLLLRKYGASVEEQAAGLLHDVGHTAFSHVIDVVFREYDHAYDDAHVEQVVRHSEVPTILARHGLDWNKIIDKQHYTLLEQPSPALCADRIDYTLRDSLPYKSDAERRFILERLTTHHGIFAFRDAQGAEALLRMYIEMDRIIWNSALGKASYGILAEALREALTKNIITEKDLYLTDREVLQKLRDSRNEKITRCLNMLSPALTIDEHQGPFEFQTLQKGRWVDPPVLVEGALVPVSRINSDVQPMIHERKTLHNQEMRFRVVSY